MQDVPRYYIGVNPPRLVEMTEAYKRDTGANGLVKGEDFDRVRTLLNASHCREAKLQEMLNKAEDLGDRPTLQKAVWDLKRQNSRLFRWSCLGYLLALGLLTFIFATGGN